MPVVDASCVDQRQRVCGRDGAVFRVPNVAGGGVFERYRFDTAPMFCYLKICGKSKLGWELVVIAFIVALGLLVFVVGTYTSLLEIVDNV